MLSDVLRNKHLDALLRAVAACSSACLYCIMPRAGLCLPLLLLHLSPHVSAMLNPQITLYNSAATALRAAFCMLEWMVDCRQHEAPAYVILLPSQPQP